MTAIIILALAAIFTLAGCGQSVPDWADKEALDAQAKNIIDTVNARDYEKLVELYSDTGPALEEWPTLLEPYTDAFGAFKGYGKTAYTTMDSDEYGELVVVLVETEYEEQEMVWQLTINQAGEVVGLRL